MLAASALPCIQQRCIKKENPTNALESETTLVVSQAPLRWAQHTQNAQGTKQSPESCSETARRTARLSHAVSLWCSKEVVCNSACDTRQVPVNAETILKVFFTASTICFTHNTCWHLDAAKMPNNAHTPLTNLVWPRLRVH